MRFLSAKYLPPSLHLGWPLMFWLYADRYTVPGWVHGVFWTLYAVVFIAGAVGIVTRKAGEPVWRGDA